MKNANSPTRYLILILAAAMLVNSKQAQADGIQMLPPTDFGGLNACSSNANPSTAGLLQWNGSDSIKCVPGATGDANGNISITGKVGIGAVDPSAPLHIFGTNNPLLKLDGSANLITALYNGSGTEKAEYGYYNSDSSFRIWNNGSYNLYIGSDNNVGIQTTNPGATLHVQNNGYGYYGFALTDPQTPGRWVRLMTEQGGGGVGMEVTQTGASDLTAWQLIQAPLGGATGTDEFYGSEGQFAIVHPGGGTGLVVSQSGDVAITGNLHEYSDKRLKKNITDLSASEELAAIQKLRPVSFDWIAPHPGMGKQYGFIAQDIQAVFPDLVTKAAPTPLAPDGALTLNYEGLIAPMVKAIQVLKADNDNLATEHAADAKAIDELRRQIDDLKKGHAQ